MASARMYKPEFLVVPLFFDPDKDDLPIGKLLQPDSVLKYLMDAWKEEAILRQYEEVIAHMRLAHTRSQQAHKDRAQGLATLLTSLPERFPSLFKLRNVLAEQWESAGQTVTASVENDILILILKYYAVVEEHKRLAELQHVFIQKSLAGTDEALRMFRRLSEFAACLEFETLSAVKLVKLTPDSSQFQRCRKAMFDNQKVDMFGGLWKGLKLIQAYKVENALVLSKFERGLATSKAMLKGLFITVSKKQLPALVILGPQSSELIKSQGINLYRQNFYRVPSTVGHKSKVEAFLAASDGFPKVITASASCTLERDRKRLESEENCVFYIVLCRAAVSRKKPEGDVSASTVEYTFQDYSALYPEYLLVCTKEPVLVLQQAVPIIPVSLAAEGRPESALMSRNEFLSRIFVDAFDSSDKQRTALRDQIRQAFASIPTLTHEEYSNMLHYSLQQSHRGTVALLQRKVDLLRRALLQTQRMNAALSSVLQSGFGAEGSVNE